jgi:hypothetical protein
MLRHPFHKSSSDDRQMTHVETIYVDDQSCKLPALNTTEPGVQFCSSGMLIWADIIATWGIVVFWSPIAVIFVYAAIVSILEARERHKN